MTESTEVTIIDNKIKLFIPTIKIVNNVWMIYLSLQKIYRFTLFCNSFADSRYSAFSRSTSSETEGESVILPIPCPDPQISFHALELSLIHISSPRD
mgnify:CR=1 FL=1